MSSTYTAFAGHRRLAAGSLIEMARAVDAAQREGLNRLFAFEDRTGLCLELDLRHGPEVAVEDYERRTQRPDAVEERRGRGRPRLGVVARDVTLLPRHWEWLSAQPGGASAAIRRLVDEARRASVEVDKDRAAREVLHRVMTTLAGNLPSFEDAMRALYAGDADRFEAIVSGWPQDVAGYVLRLKGDLRLGPDKSG